MLLVGVVLCGGAVWGCPPGGNAASQGGGVTRWEELSRDCEEHVPSEVAMPELWLKSYSHSYLPVFYFQSLLMGFFTALQHPHIFLNLVFITSVPALSLIMWMYILLLIKQDPCMCFLFDLICLWVKFYVSNPGLVLGKNSEPELVVSETLRISN